MRIFLLLALSLGTALASAKAPQPKASKASQKIDQILAGHWKKEGIQPAPIIDDETFVRRIYLDVVGRIPQPKEAEEFLASQDPYKRAQLIDELLASEGYVNHFFNYWADVLRLHAQVNGGGFYYPPYADWIREALSENRPYDEMVRQLLTAEGNPWENGAVGYYGRDRGMPLDHMANTVRIFLGTRIECAQCHNHPFDKWTQMEFYQMAGFSYGMNANSRLDPTVDAAQKTAREKYKDQKDRRDIQRAFSEISRPLRSTTVRHEDKLPQLPHDYAYDDAKPKEKIEPVVMFGGDIRPETLASADKLETYAKWMTSPENERFTKVIANRLWKKAFGKGVIEPVDEMTDHSMEVVPGLLPFLEKEMRRGGYDLKGFLRSIYNSKAYQREATADDETTFVHDFNGPTLRRMSAEQMWDSVITLIHPAPDMPNIKRATENEMKKVGLSNMGNAFRKLSEEDLLKHAERILAYQKKQRGQLEKLQEQIKEARENKEDEKAKELSREAGKFTARLRAHVVETVYEPVLKKDGKFESTYQMPGMGASMKMTNEMVDIQGRPNGTFRKAQTEMIGEIIDNLVEGREFEDEKKKKSYRGYLSSRLNNYLRASHIGSPAPRGHFLREFGQSDRETIENAEVAASVSQALTLLNGSTFDTVRNMYSELMLAIQQAETPTEKIDALYASFYSRKPTADETAFLLSEMEKRGDEIWNDAIFALLNSQEFIFIR